MEGDLAVGDGPNYDCVGSFLYKRSALQLRVRGNILCPVFVSSCVV